MVPVLSHCCLSCCVNCLLCSAHFIYSIGHLQNEGLVFLRPVQIIPNFFAQHVWIIKPFTISSLCLSPVPCVPTDVVVKMDCAENEAIVTWRASEGALSYKVSAKSSEGSMSLCESTDPVCTLTDLKCGQAYFVQVVAEDDICSSLPSPTIEFNSGRTAG